MATAYSYACKDYPGMGACPGKVTARTEAEVWKLMELHAAVAHDPTTEIDDALMKAVGETGSDLVVMASHVPGVMDYIWPSHGGKLASHSRASVLLVR